MAIYRGSRNFFDNVIDGYSTQDTLQMISPFFSLLKIIAEDYAKVEQMGLQSDNAPVYACAENSRIFFR